jgi:dipeptide/tripeptide permease
VDIEAGCLSIINKIYIYVVYELFERMAYYGIASNLIIYLTDHLHQGTVEASNNVTNWSGTVFLTPLLGAYLADAYLGRYWTFVVGSAIYFTVRTYCLHIIVNIVKYII